MEDAGASCKWMTNERKSQKYWRNTLNEPLFGHLDDGDIAIQSQSCHGSMSRVSAAGREGWFDQPNCQSCHSGTATDNNGQIRDSSVFDELGEPRDRGQRHLCHRPGHSCCGRIALPVLHRPRRSPVRGVPRFDPPDLPLEPPQQQPAENRPARTRCDPGGLRRSP